MIKFVGGIVVGVFVGAMTVEILSRKFPGLFSKLEDRGREAADKTEELLRRMREKAGASF